MSTTRAEQKQLTRKALIAAAMKVYERDGLSAARTADVAEQAGVAHGSVFVHFLTREALFAAAIEEFGIALTDRLHELAADGAGLRAALEAHLHAIREREGFYTRLAMESPLLPKDARQSLLGIQSAISAHIAEAARRDADSGLIRPVPIHLLFNTWIGLVHYYLANRDLFALSGSVIDGRGTELIDHFMSLMEPCPDQREDTT